MLETLDYTIRIGSTPTFLYFDLYLYSAHAAHYDELKTSLYLPSQEKKIVTTQYMGGGVSISYSLLLPGSFPSISSYLDQLLPIISKCVLALKYQ